LKLLRKNFLRKILLDMEIRTIYTLNMFYNLLIANRLLNKTAWHPNAVAGGGFY
jgi:hypothetical protein